MNDFDDLLSGALGARGDNAAAGTPDAGDAVRRARHHRAVRRTVAASSVAVLAFAGVAGLMLRSTDDPSPVADGPQVDSPADSGCAEGQIRTADGDIVLHDGRPYTVAAGQCLAATEQEPGIATCEVSVSGSDSPEQGVVSSEGEGKGCVLVSGGAFCPAPTLPPVDPTAQPDPATVSTVVIKSGAAPSNVPWECAAGCGSVFVTSGGVPGSLPEGDAPLITSFSSAMSDDASDDSPDPGDPPSMVAVAEACTVSTAATPPPADSATDTTVQVQG